MKLLIFGTGMIVNDFLNGVEEMPFDKVYLCGRTKEKVDEMVEKFSLDGAFYNVSDALASDAEVAYVGLPNNLHFEYAKASLEAGKHVIVEKPFMTTEAEAQEIFAIARKAQKFVFEAALVFYFPAYKALAEDLATLGEIHLVDSNFSQYSSRYDRFLNGDIAPALNIKNCGGALMDLNVYNINLCVGLFGAPDKATYSATTKGGIDVSGVALLEYGPVRASCIASKSTSAPRHITIQGEKGSIYLPSSTSRAYEYRIDYNDGKTIVRDFRDEHHRMYHEFCEFANIIADQNAEAFEEIASRSLITMKVLDTCRKSANIK